MPPKPEKSNKTNELKDVINQLKEMQISLENNQQTFVTNQITAQLTLLSKPSFHPKTPKITLTCFDGSNPLDWIFQAKQFFDLHQTPPHQRMSFIPFLMKGPALDWFRWLHSKHQTTTWEAFTRALELRFGPSTFEYQLQFETLSNRVTEDQTRVTTNNGNKCRRDPSNQTIINGDLYINLEGNNSSMKEKARKSPSPPKGPVFNCPICMGPLIEATSTRCGHIFCKNCIRAAITAQGKCPTCRKKATLKELIRVFLPSTS